MKPTEQKGEEGTLLARFSQIVWSMKELVEVGWKILTSIER